jgi:[ribosomal protein S18]-alanine N-acetyltransferase
MDYPFYLARLTVEDIPALQVLEQETNLSFWGVENYRRFLEDFPEYFGCKVSIMDEEGTSRLAGFLLGRSLFENLEVLKLGVHKEFQRRGFGTLLMDAAYAEGIRRGCSRCFLEVRKSNQNAIGFYLGHKFRISGVRAAYYSDPVEDAWIMERTI